MQSEREIALEEENARLRADITTMMTELNAEINGREAENARLRQIVAAMDGRICQVLGRALGYPRYADDQTTFPGATDADGVCTGEFVAEYLAEQAAERIAHLEGDLAKLQDPVAVRVNILRGKIRIPADLVWTRDLAAVDARVATLEEANREIEAENARLRQERDAAWNAAIEAAAMEVAMDEDEQVGERIYNAILALKKETTDAE